MKIVFILPAIGKKPGEKYIGTWKMEPLTIAVLSSLTPARFERQFFDDRIELIDYDTPADLVVITLETYTAKRGYTIAARFRQRGVPVLVGGYHATLLPNEAQLHADSVLCGNAETVWGMMLDDFENRRLQKRYYGSTAYTSVMPDRSVFAGKKYLPIRMVETGRGCGHNCSFCAIAAYYGCEYHPRPQEQVTADLAASPHKYHFLVDDNLVADLGNCKTLLQKITPLNIKWAGQGTLTMARDPELLRLMKRSGCELILIGFESLNPQSLAQMNKSWETALGERDELVQRIHDAGLGIYATFVFGYDGDDEAAFVRTLEFSKKHRFYTAAFNHLLPFPGTATYANLRDQNRLLREKWWLEDDYNYGELAFRPKHMSAERMSNLCRDARREFSGAAAVFNRGIAAMGRSSPLMWSLFWAMNLRLGREVDEKMNVPIGKNLDELPK